MAGFANPDTPNIADFLTFLADVQIPAAALPSNSPYPQYALTQAMALVNSFPSGLVNVPGIMYTLAVYNCATHLVFAITPDQPGSDYFSVKRGSKGFSLALPSNGLVISTSDNGTSVSLAEPMWARGLLPSDLGFMKTPWGREYVTWQLSYGPSIIGLS